MTLPWTLLSRRKRHLFVKLHGRHDMGLVLNIINNRRLDQGFLVQCTFLKFSNYSPIGPISSFLCFHSGQDVIRA